jgi:hypothetical protein
MSQPWYSVLEDFTFFQAYFYEAAEINTKIGT